MSSSLYSSETCREIADFAQKYVLERISNDAKRLDLLLNEWDYYERPQHMSDLFRVMLIHASNRQSMPNAIGDIEKLRPFLFGFMPQNVVQSYATWEDLFDTIQENYAPPGRMDKENPRSYWVIFCKSILSIAKFLSRFESMSTFYVYVDQFVVKDNPDLRIALPLLLSQELFGFQFALACDFIKSQISPDFVKPDVHIRDIFIGMRFCSLGDSDFDVFRSVVLFANTIEKKPYWVDMLFWLIGSGRMPSTDAYPQELRFKTSKKEFIQLVNEHCAEL